MSVHYTDMASLKNTHVSIYFKMVMTDNIVILIAIFTPIRYLSPYFAGRIKIKTIIAIGLVFVLVIQYY